MSVLASALVASLSLQNATANDFVVATDVVFAERGSQRLALDLVRPRGDGPFPTMLCLHGGGWRQGDRHEMLAIVEDWARAGYVAATASYRLVPEGTWPAPLDDCVAALAFLRANAARFHLDRGRIGATGFSAGGHLALLLGLDDERTAAAGGPVRLVVNYFGPTDLRMFAQARGPGPVLTLHGSDDRLVPVHQAEALHAHLRQAGVPNELSILDGRGHGWRGDDLRRTQAQARAFADLYMRAGALPLLVAEDFDGEASAVELFAPEAFVTRSAPRRCLALTGKSTYAPPVRSPTALAVLRAPRVTDFVLDVDVRSTTAEYGHRDLCVFFGYQSPTRFYYAHLATKPDDHAHGIFLVDDRDRVNIVRTRSAGMRWGDGWRRVRVRRDTASGDIEVFVDDFAEPILTAQDTTLTAGRVGVGSFDDLGEFAALRLYGRP